jgi:hypothetical protein
MRLTVYTADDRNIVIEDFAQDSVLDLIEDLKDPDTQVFTFALGGQAMAYVMRAHLVRVDLDY